jgi:hypothetical protein
MFEDFNTEVNPDDMRVKKIQRPAIIQVDPFRQFCEMLAETPGLDPSFRSEVIKSLNSESRKTTQSPA